MITVRQVGVRVGRSLRAALLAPPRPIELTVQPQSLATPELQLESVAPLNVRPARLEQDAIWTEGAIQHPAAFVMDFGQAFNSEVIIRAASLKGTGHFELGQPRQDAYCVVVQPGFIHVAVADGVGSEDLSHVGATTAARVAVEASKNGYGADKIVDSVIRALASEASELEIDPQRLSTTLCWARIQVGRREEPWSVEAAEWGDTEVLVYDSREVKNGHPSWLRLPKQKHSDAFANSVRALPSHRHLVASVSDAQWYEGQVLCFLSDGIASDVRSDTLLGHKLAKAWHSVPSPWEFAGHVAFRYASANDDRTAVVLWRTPHGVPSPATLQSENVNRAETPSVPRNKTDEENTLRDVADDGGVTAEVPLGSNNETPG